MSLFKNLFGSGPSTGLKEAIEQGAFLVDVREPDEFAGGTAKGAVTIPFGNVAAELDKFKGKENIVVFCRSGARSGQAKTILEQNGFKKVINGGAWEEVDQFARK